MSEMTRKKTSDAVKLQIEPACLRVFYYAPVPIVIVREDQRILLVNHAAQVATGIAFEENITLNTLIKGLQAEPADLIEKHLSGRVDFQDNALPLHVMTKTKDGQPIFWDLFIAPLGRTADGQRVIIGIASDISKIADHEQHLKAVNIRLEHEAAERNQDLNATIHALENEISERKIMSDALTLSRERLKIISRRTLNVLEADRRTVSKELHDSIGAGLAAIKFSLEEKEMNRNQANGRLDESLEPEIAYLAATIKESKRISANLRPTTLDDLGLMATIKWYLRQFQRMYGNIRVDYSTEIDETDVPEPMKIIIYRLIQEGLTNAEKHSEAESVRLHMEFSDGKQSVSLFIEDDGRGFNVEDVLSERDPLSGYGLIAMRERCEIFGGSFHIESRIGAGTRINAILPV